MRLSPKGKDKLVATLRELIDRDTERLHEETVKRIGGAYDESLKNAWPSLDRFNDRGVFITTTWMAKHLAVFARQRHDSVLVQGKDERVFALVVTDASDEERQEAQDFSNDV